MLAFAFARKWPNLTSNAVDPGWVATKMGGAGAMDDLGAAVNTFAMLAEGAGAAEGVTGKYFYQMKTKSCKAAAGDVEAQEKLLKALEQVSGVRIPENATETIS